MNKKYTLLTSRMRERLELSALIENAGKVDPRFADFIAWARIRRPLEKIVAFKSIEEQLSGSSSIDAEALEFIKGWVDHSSLNDETLDFIVGGVERFINGNTNPWPKPRGVKAKPDTMWACYWLATMPARQKAWLSDVTFPEEEREYLRQHKEEGGAYCRVAEVMNTSASNVETHVRNAVTRLKSVEGRIEFLTWIRNNVKHPEGLIPFGYYPPDCPKAEARYQGLVDAGVLKPKRKK